MDEPEEIKFDVDMQGKECVFVKFGANHEMFNHKGNTLLNFTRGGSRATFKNPKSGILRLNTEAFKGGESLENGMVVAWRIGDCKHDMIMKDICAVCGESMATTSFIQDKQQGKAQYVSSVHNKPELVISLETAKQNSDANQKQLLDRKKLILLVDLDQTLIHTTNKQPKPNEFKQDVHGFRLLKIQYYTKIRPHALNFLDNISKLFELHVVTYGQRVYAEKIVELLDRDKKYFASRILSRDELISANSKSVNLQALFPSGDHLVMMIDDRADVWENSEALIWIKPYKFFNEVGDINAINVDKGNESPVDDETKRISNANAENESDDKPVEAPTNGNAVVDDQVPGTSNGQEVIDKKPLNTNDDSDDILTNIEQVLTNIHSAFFEQYNQDQSIIPVSEFAANFRKQVLKDEVIVFSGVVRINAVLKDHPLYHCCTRLGARVEEEFSDETTTLIAVRPQTEKYHMAKRRNIPIVTIYWIEECLAYWRKVDKEKFTLQATAEYDSTLSNTLSHMDRLTKTDLNDMQDEVDRELAELSSSSDEEETNLEPLIKKQKI
ncbi:RNA polymerase II subunit A C-terminal domain phosphatase [Aphelenchoides bicaudatus]|nr:RNA polymerase II subunit A C-terminal domain phosphatase [Aphelenchoides bicaudatus]